MQSNPGLEEDTEERVIGYVEEGVPIKRGQHALLLTNKTLMTWWVNERGAPYHYDVAVKAGLVKNDVLARISTTNTHLDIQVTHYVRPALTDAQIYDLSRFVVASIEGGAAFMQLRVEVNGKTWFMGAAAELAQAEPMVLQRNPGEPIWSMTEKAYWRKVAPLPKPSKEMTDEEHSAWYAKASAARTEHERAMKKAVTMGLIPRERLIEISECGGSHGNCYELPETLYHVTTNQSAVLAEGFKTRDELRQALGKGLGGGTSDTISFTDNRKVAEGIFYAVIEAHCIASGKIGVQTLIEQAMAGTGAKHPWLDNWLKHVHINPEWFRENYHDGQLELDEANSLVVLGTDLGRVLFGLKRGEMFETIPCTAKEKSEALFRVFKQWLFWREEAGGPLDPLFFMADQEYLGAVPLEEIAILKCTTKEGTMGCKVGGLAEWRIWSGEAIEHIGIMETADNVAPCFTEYSSNPASNPPWADKIFKQVCDDLELTISRQGLPMPIRKEDSCVPVKELGCGHYGCVYETEDPGVVFKLTTDETEAWFVQTALKLFQNQEWPRGLVRYHTIYGVPDVKHRKRNVFVLWRDSVEHVGYPMSWQQKHQDELEASNWLMKYKDAAATLRDVLQKKKTDFDWATLPDHPVIEQAKEYYWDAKNNQSYTHWESMLLRTKRLSGNDAVAWLYAMLWIAVEELMQNGQVYLIGEVLRNLLEQGIVLADVHLNNVGQKQYEGYHSPVWIITDPGHALSLNPALQEIDIPEPLEAFHPGRISV